MDETQNLCNSPFLLIFFLEYAHFLFSTALITHLNCKNFAVIRTIDGLQWFSQYAFSQ